MPRFIAAAIVSAAAIAYALGLIEGAFVVFAFGIGIMIVLANMEAKINRAWTGRAQRILEYKVAAVGMGNLKDLHQFEAWLEGLNDERWELVTIIEPAGLEVKGMHYAIFARPKRAGETR